VVPLWRNASGTEANITAGLLEYLAQAYEEPVLPEDFLAYCYAILTGPEYTRRFAEDLTTSAPRIPITTDVDQFRQGVELGQRLIWLQTYGARFVPEGERRNCWSCSGCWGTLSICPQTWQHSLKPCFRGTFWLRKFYPNQQRINERRQKYRGVMRLLHLSKWLSASNKVGTINPTPLNISLDCYPICQS